MTKAEEFLKVIEAWEPGRLEITRWIRALELAKLLFEDQGYHGQYLDEIKRFIVERHHYKL